MNPQMPAEFKILVTPQELDVVMASMMNEPWGKVNNIIAKITQQANNPSLQAPAESPDAILPAELERAMKAKPGASAQELFDYAIQMRAATSSVTVDLPAEVHPGDVPAIRQRLASVLATVDVEASPLV